MKADLALQDNKNCLSIYLLCSEIEKSSAMKDLDDLKRAIKCFAV
jgi:hypothetical protein